ncbi:MAG: xanthine dehydrogenase subunit D [Acidimicrobiales bacterium]|jgi:xanthine dehydrogenase D subunit|nr:xanthine dehydrogenase subunit D [Acidimicrobiaceae bacterium]MDP7259026.1 xanthine dehydrogenase subunit D [Acidimicrobiales bacterium]HJO79076.1 xanthine dehydrogenase subunit D [Acidimicrobiales bacterium]|tara:strand:+ start:2319 stop:4598 length:2280 start_codon:yes stop_codon:yes gene_type:complete
MTGTRVARRTGTAPRIGESARRPDGVPKATGSFSFSSDLRHDRMLWGGTLRSPHPSARIRSVQIGEAVAVTGVHAVLLSDDVPGQKVFGLEHRDQPVLAGDVVRYEGEPIAIVAADHPEAVRTALRAIVVDYEVLTPVVDPMTVEETESIHPDGNLIRRIHLRHGSQDVVGDVQVEGTYEVAMQDQAFLGPESGMAVPADDGSIDLYVATQWLHSDRDQVADCMGLDPEKVRLTLAGVGGAFGAREDLSLHVHLCMLAQHTGRPVKMVYSREESFHGHVHRHPAQMWYRHHADRDGTLVRVEARLILDGGAYASSSSAVIANATCFAAGPYRVPSAEINGAAVRTNNPPCGAMRGFGAVQTCFAHEAQMDRLAKALGMDPVELRLHNALVPGDKLLTGQTITGTAPVAEVIRTCAEHPSAAAIATDPLELPGGTGRTADPGHVVRGEALALGFKNLMFSEGFDDSSEASCRLLDGVATITSACAEVGQGFVTVVQQIVREVLGVDEVVLLQASTADVGSAGSTSASRQTWMSGGAVQEACGQVRVQLLERLATQCGVDTDDLVLADGQIVSLSGGLEVDLAVATEEPVEASVVFRHAPTWPLDEHGQGSAHVAFAFSAHRAIVDVDTELGLVKVVELTTSQDVGRVLNPMQVVGQLEGGAAQGVGLAVMEEVLVTDGRIRNASFTDYLVPTALDMPPVEIAALIEQAEPGAPFGAKGIGEAPAISSTAAVAAAIRNATGLNLPRVPVRPVDIVFPEGAT